MVLIWCLYFSSDSVLPIPISQKSPSMPIVLACMKNEGNTLTSKITCIDSMIPLPLTTLDNCLAVVEVVGVQDGGLKENIRNMQEGVSKWGFCMMMYMRIYILTLRKTLEILQPLHMKPHKRTNKINSSIKENFLVRDTINRMINRVIIILLITL